MFHCKFVITISYWDEIRFMVLKSYIVKVFSNYFQIFPIR